MANEISLDIGLNLTRSNIEMVDWGEMGLSLNQIGSRSTRQIINVGTNNSLLPIPSGTLGYCMAKNLDTGSGGKMSFVTSASGVKFIDLLPGEVTVFKFGIDVTIPYLVTTNYSHQAEIVILEL